MSDSGTRAAAGPRAGEGADASRVLRGVILAGGAARRMGGGDKPLLEIAGRTILARAVDRLAAQLPGGRAALALSANGPPERFAAAGAPVLPDPSEFARADAAPGDVLGPDGAPRLGPLAGVLAGLDWAAGEGATHLVSVAGDTPFFPDDLVDGLLGALSRDPAAAIAVAAIRDTRTADARSGGAAPRLRPQPTFALWPVASAPALRESLRRGVRKILAFADAEGWTAAVFPAAAAGDALYDPFWNVNTPEDLAAAAEAAAFWDARR